MALSIFDEKANQPSDDVLSKTLGEIYPVWNDLKNYALSKNNDYYEEWSFTGKNYGWGFRIREKKRVIVYMTPNKDHFLFSVVFGEKATNEALESEISKDIKGIISSAKVYAEGRGIRMEVKNKMIVSDLKKLIDIKTKY